MNQDKSHYYDGKLYGIIFDYALKEIRDTIIAQIEPGSNLIDIGCGTGSLVFDLAKKCNSVTGVELSSKMFDYAKRRQLANKIQNIRFIHGDAANLPDFKDKQFDYATFSMAIHEMPPDLRVKVLLEAKRIAKKIIIADFAAPLPNNLMGIMTRIIEFSAGIDHFRCFLDYQKNHGTSPLLSICQLSVYKEFTIKYGAMKIVAAKTPNISQ
ncbi:MAG: class I SAM-dependent methyltransferase [Proteobacteria bacterium]|nr:class I SAM-dependent methyltransferase [Pseudomonadota bacterium]MBU4035850.1 class I SAM-dependent methyltransferase [Pseudomonadota bacterium]